MKILKAIKEYGLIEGCKREIKQSLCSSVEHEREPKIVNIKSKYGEFYLVENDAISQGIINGGNWEEHFQKVVTSFLPKNANAIDLGANFGFHSIWLGKYLEDGRVFSFEPLSLTYSQLQLNVIANGLTTNVFPYKLAISDVTGSYVEMNKIKYGSQRNINVGDTSIGKGGDATLTLKLDDLPLPKIDFMKIDIQGSEYKALIGMSNMIQRDRPLMFIEIEEHHLVKFGTSSKEVIEYLFSINYVLLRIKTSYPTDHIAIPGEWGEETCQRMKATLEKDYPIDYLSGERIELHFKEHPSYYSDYKINP